jgi:hypothetical protein
MLNIKCVPHIDGALKALADIAKSQVPYATSVALNECAAIARDADIAEMRKAFKSPVPYTLGALAIRRATKQNLVATVAVKNQSGGRLSPIHWLFPEVEGGSRNTKAFEKALTNLGVLPSGWSAVPAGGAPLDAYGNVSGALVRKILSVLQNSGFVGPRLPGIEGSVGRRLAAKRRRARATAAYFAVAPGDEEKGGLRPGIYQRLGARELRIIYVFLARVPSYRKRYNFYEIGMSAANRAFPEQFDIAMAKAIATAR